MPSGVTLATVQTIVPTVPKREFARERERERVRQSYLLFNVLPSPFLFVFLKQYN